MTLADRYPALAALLERRGFSNTCDRLFQRDGFKVSWNGKSAFVVGGHLTTDPDFVTRCILKRFPHETECACH